MDLQYPSLNVAVILFIVVLTLVFAFSMIRVKHSKRSPLPPGPRGLPLVGYLPFVLAKKPTELMLKLRKKYGNIFGFRVGVHYCVMLSDYKSVRTAFTKKQFLDRPSKYMRMSTTNQTLAELKGPPWEEQRYFLVTCLKKLGIGGEKFEENVLEELSRVIPKMEACCGDPKTSIRDVFSGSMNNVVFRLVCGRWFEDDHQIMKDFLHFQILLVESFSNNMPIIYFPWIDWFLLNFQPHMKAVLKAASVIENFIRSEVEAHKKVHNESCNNDYIDLYITERKARTMENNVSSFTSEQLVYNCLLFLLAGTDTVRNTLEWLLMAVAKYPEVQTKVQAEIDDVLGRERTPVCADKVNLPYTEAVIMESERWMTLEPLNLLRRTTADTEVRGYFIPKDTVVINNLHFCHMDPEYWESPEDFRPERFLSKDKSRVVVPEYFIPFSVGKRDCPGDKMANIEIFLYFTAFMQKFKFSPCEGGIDFSASHRMNLQAHFPFLKVELR